MTLFEWEGPAAYRVAFSTRVGGVSKGPYESLNLGLLTDDSPSNVVENRRLLCAALGADPDSAAMAYQVHGARVVEAGPRGVVTPGVRHEACDGLWSDRPGQAMMLVTADCFPVAVARLGGEPALAVLHVGWRGLLGGIVENGVAAVGGERAAAVGPGIGACCYEVGEEIAGRFRARFGAGVVAGRNLDLGLAVERALREAGVEEVERTSRCTSCDPDLFFSHRRDGGVTGRQGIVAYVR